MNQTHFFAVDLGATSGRTILGSIVDGKLRQRELTRFPNHIIRAGRHDYWDLFALYHEIVRGLKLAADAGIPLTSIGIDTWGLDIVCIGHDGDVLRNPYSYRDPHTEGAMDEYFKLVPKETVYRKTGIQFMPINTLFQLTAMRRDHDSALEAAGKLLFMPDALMYLLTGEAVCEYTILSTSQMMDARTKKIDPELAGAIGLSESRFGRYVHPCDRVGVLTPQLQRLTGLGAVPVVAVAGHDTGSAVAAVPAQDERFAYLSCGTWSLLGIESHTPIINERSFKENFTNEGGIDGTTRFLKNICGLWIFEKCREDFYKDPVRFPDAPEGVRELSAKCLESSFDSIIFPDDDLFVHPDSMTEAICEYCRRTRQEEPVTVADYIRCIYRSLALRYRDVVSLLSEMCGFPIESLNVIGGGSQNQYLMQMAADALGIPVICGPTEGTALGNALVQLRAAGKVSNLWEMRAIGAASVDLKTYLPQA